MVLKEIQKMENSEDNFIYLLNENNIVQCTCQYLGRVHISTQFSVIRRNSLKNTTKIQIHNIIK